MKNIYRVVLSVIILGGFVSCDYDDDMTPPNYVTFDATSSSTQVAIGGSTSYDVSVYTGNIVSTDRTFDIAVRETSSLSSAAYSLPETVTIPGGSNEAVFTIDIEDVDMVPNGGNLIMGLVPQAGLSAGRDLNLNVTWSCDTPLVIDFVFDAYASETGWEVTDTEGNVLLEGGGFEDGMTGASVERCLPEGDYTFTLLDAYGDGISAPGGATLSYNGVELAVVPGSFTTETSIDFTLE